MSETVQAAPPETPAPAAQPPSRRGRVITAVVVGAVIVFGGVAHLTGPLIPLLVLAAVPLLAALVLLVRAGSRLLPKRRARSRGFRPSRPRRTATGGTQRRRPAGSRPKGLTSPRLGKSSGRGKGRQPGTGLPFRRRGNGSSGRRQARRGPSRRAGAAGRRGNGRGFPSWPSLRRRTRRRSTAAPRRAPRGAPARRRRFPRPVKTWRRWRTRRKDRRNPAPPPAPPPPAKPKPQPQARPQRAPALNRPGPPVKEGTPARKEPTVSSHIDAASEAVDQHVGGWEPENALDLDQFLGALPRLFESVAQSLTTVAERLGDQFPVDPAVPEHLREIASTVAGMSDYAGEAHDIHRKVHEKELERLENPRPNEQMWDVRENQ